MESTHSQTGNNPMHRAAREDRGPLGRVRNDAPGFATGGGFRLGRLAGVQIVIDWSLLIIFALVSFNLGAGLFPSWHPEWSAGLVWGLAFAAATLFFGSVLVHELSHALVARMFGIRVDSITLFLFGGLADMESEPEAPKAELLVAVVGPLTSIVIGITASLIGGQLAGDALAEQGVRWGNASPDQLRAAVSMAGPWATLLLWLGPINLLLGVFNLVPGFPLDGGRVLRALLWWGTGDLTRATRWATATGRGFAWILMSLGVLDLFHGALGQGLWLILIGWFLNNAARASYRQLLTRKAFQDVPVSQVMWREPKRVPPDLTLDRFVHEYLMPSEQLAFPVEREGVLLGMVLFDDVRTVSHECWGDTTVESIMTPIGALPRLRPDSSAQEALGELARRDVDQLPVLDGSQLCGLLRRRDLVRWLALHGEPEQTLLHH